MPDKYEAPLAGGAPGQHDLTGGAIAPGINGHPPPGQFVERQLELFGARCQELADRVRAGQIAFIEAVDMAYEAAIWSGLTDAAGDDPVQWVMATVFMDLPRPSTKQTGGEHAATEKT